MNNIAGIQKKLTEKNLDAIVIIDEKNQRYAVGFPFTDGAVVVSREKAWLITDSRFTEAATAACACCTEIREYTRERPLVSLIRSALDEVHAEKIGAEESSMSYHAWKDWEEKLKVSFLPAQDILSELRQSKSEEEIACMTKAQRISEQAFEEILTVIRPGMTEQEVMAELVYRMLRHGSEGNSFDPIVVTGSKTSMPHGVPGDKVIQDGDFLTMDFGSLCFGYCSDMTRTVAVGHATEEMRNIYSIVLEAQLAGISTARAGIPGCEVDAAARKVIADAGYGEYFGHGFGHSLGLDIHENPGCNGRDKKPLPAGAVVSAEPGIYIPGKFGCRIEDVVIVREGGCDVITRAPKSELIIVK